VEQTLDCGDESLAFIEHVDCLTNMNDVMDAMERFLARFGFEKFVLHGLCRPTQRFEDAVVGRNWPIEWCEIYAKEQYADDDPIASLLKRTAKPFEWSERLYDAAQAPRAAEIMRRRKEFGIERGFIVPFHGAPCGIGFVHMSGDRFDLTARSYPAVHLVAFYAFDRACELRAPRAREKPLLTAREREVLTWAAHGKTAWEIGEILAISERTVNEHAQTAFRKLGAVNRTQAVAIALRDHLVE
jgi:LuxR family quorum sensing-dependent transcriptional regulator